ncbi:hypothetical protein Nepgr_020772 [Nepenthes gracilis]|uniref:Uncharacterized protein n=1 Tax=Nepenthes gracilis TaxID=150966 RepID=A0AAD3XWQ1_NEPGR|nr:hypothetical protein Nepgr_020772 [Nepenthes gracilis]
MGHSSNSDEVQEMSKSRLRSLPSWTRALEPHGDLGNRPRLRLRQAYRGSTELPLQPPRQREGALHLLLLDTGALRIDGLGEGVGKAETS